jgi:DNA (cytosine-5)-methyltransferase 1
MTHGSLFSGIGGFDLAAEWMGWENKFHCEWNDFGQKVLKYYWPNAESFHDITKTNFTKYANKIDILTGGFPCQPYSMAGKRKGKDDERHLWPEMLRCIREVKPRWVIGENVLGLVNWSEGLVFHEVQADLEAEGYEVFPYVLAAATVNAPHRRDRIWFVAYSSCASERANQLRSIRQEDGEISREGSQTIYDATRSNGIEGITSDTENFRRANALENGELEGRRFRQPYKRNAWDSFPSVAPICVGDDGIPNRLDGITFSKWRKESIKAAGNAIVPQVALQIFKAIEQFNHINQT